MPRERFNPAPILETHFATLLRSRAEGIPGTSRTYSAEELIKKIERVRHGHANLQTVTRTFGINRKVESLFSNDPTFGK